MSIMIKTQVIDSRNLLRGVTNFPLPRRNSIESQVQDKDDPEELVASIPESTQLILSFRNIAFVENLIGFLNLQKLCLDNNELTEIKNLSHLINLTWLDLSFNRISKIEGLDQLHHLEDLSLYSNQIQSVTGLNGCPKLKCLSLGKNNIMEVSDLLNVSQWSSNSLRMLTLAGNPICKLENYKAQICSLFPSIDYLDYRLVDAVERGLHLSSASENVDVEGEEHEPVLPTKEEPAAAYHQKQGTTRVHENNIATAELALAALLENKVYKNWMANLESSTATSVLNRLSLLKDDAQAALSDWHHKYQRSYTEYARERDAAVNLVDEDRGALVAGYEQARLSVSKPISERDNKTTFAQWRDSLTGLEKQFALVTPLYCYFILLLVMIHRVLWFCRFAMA